MRAQTLTAAIGVPFALVAVLFGCGGGDSTPSSPSSPSPDAGADVDASVVTCVGRSIVLTRHAEKGADGTDPGLTADGKARAERLAKMFADATITRLVATEYKRTQETLAPLATRTGLSVDVHKAADGAALAAELEKSADGTFVVVAGHSNTVPELVSALVGGSKPTIGEDQYSRVFVLEYGCDGAAPKVTERSSD